MKGLYFFPQVVGSGGPSTGGPGGGVKIAPSPGREQPAGGQDDSVTQNDEWGEGEWE